MFAFSGRFRRRVAVLSVFALLAGVLVVAAPAAAADPKADYKAMFSACIGDAADDAGFTDVPEGHANSGDIDCIAYYGVTKGTSASTYSPLQSVNREQMALFLTRLAKTVGIDVDDDPDDPGFTDTGDLSAESQMAIAQLADLGITQGTSATTYSPSDPVRRDHMALFISRLMNQMTPQADGEIGLSSTEQYGYTPSDVAANDMGADIGSPFTDINSTTKFAYDAITQLYELDVAAGISDTSYAPDEDITRASMAGFMAAVLDHSNARPFGLTIQASHAEGWGDQEPTILVSVRDDAFMAVEDQAVDMFSSTSANQGIRKDGTCNFGTNPDDVYRGDFIDGDCTWSTNDTATDVNGNVVTEREVQEGRTRVFHAWIGNANNQKYDQDTNAGVNTSVAARYAQDDLSPGSSINAHAYDAGDGQQVDLGVGRKVTASAQLIDVNGNDVMRPGVSFRVEYRQGPDTAGQRDSRGYVDSHEAVLVTDDTGSVSFDVFPPADNPRVATQERKDSVVFTELDANGADTDRNTEVKIHWIEDEPVLTSDSLTKPVYVLAGNPAVDVRVHLWDQYGNPHRSHSAQKAEITLTDDETTDGEASDGNGPGEGPAVRQVISRGYARWTSQVEVAENQMVEVTYDVRQLARNSRGVPVRLADGGVADYAAWADLFPGSSSSSRQTIIDAFGTTYNDGSVYVARTETDGVVSLGNADVYDVNDDAADGTDNDPATVDDPDWNDDSDPANPDPTSESGTVLITSARANAAINNIINPGALDTYVDRGQGQTAPNVRGTSMDNSATGNMVYVVEKATSRNVGTDVLAIVMALPASDSFLTDSLATAETDTKPELIYVYNDDDIFIDSTDVREGIEISMATFENMISRSQNQVERVEVIAYDVDGVSIFRLHSS